MGNIHARVLALEQQEGRRAELARLLADSGLQYEHASPAAEHYVAGGQLPPGTCALGVVLHLLGTAEAQHERCRALQDRWAVLGGWAASSGWVVG